MHDDCGSALTNLLGEGGRITTLEPIGARAFPYCRIESICTRARLKVARGRADDPLMMISSEYFVLLVIAVAGSALTLYIMRRRVRLGRRSPKF
jgi:hypothetical protein